MARSANPAKSVSPVSLVETMAVRRPEKTRSAMRSLSELSISSSAPLRTSTPWETLRAAITSA